MFGVHLHQLFNHQDMEEVLLMDFEVVEGDREMD
jgi:hypothetical protein